MDLFVSGLNNKPDTYCSRENDQGAYRIDGLSLDWNGLETYAFPPEPLIQRVIQKVKFSTTRMILVAPNRSRKPWMSVLVELLLDIPRVLPQKEKLLRMPNSRVFHPDPESRHLVAWMIGGESLDKGFQRGAAEMAKGDIRKSTAS